MRRKSFAVVGAACAVIAVAGCSNPAADATASGGGKGQLPASCKQANPVLGVALPNTVNPYYVAMQKGFHDAGKANGFTVKMAIANDSDSNQLSQVQAFIQQGVCAVALNAVNSAPGVASVAALNKAGIPVFTVNVTIDAKEMKNQGASIVQYVGADQVEGGTAMGKQLIKDRGNADGVVAGIVGDPDQIPTNQRDQGFKDALGPAAKIKTTVNSKVDPNVALQVTTEMLQGNPDINIVFADTGPGAVGAIQAVKQLGLENKVAIYGFCAADTALTGAYKACAAQEPADYARIVVEQAHDYIQGKKVKPEILQPLKVFTAGQTPGQGEVG